MRSANCRRRPASGRRSATDRSRPIATELCQVAPASLRSVPPAPDLRRLPTEDIVVLSHRGPPGLIGEAYQSGRTGSDGHQPSLENLLGGQVRVGFFWKIPVAGKRAGADQDREPGKAQRGAVGHLASRIPLRALPWTRLEDSKIRVLQDSPALRRFSA